MRYHMDSKFVVYIAGRPEVLDINKDYLSSGLSGRCYRLRRNFQDLTVKIYHKEPIFSDHGSWYPSEEELKKMISFSDYTAPVLLSKYIVRDENSQYIGFARNYIESTCDDVVGAIFEYPKEKILGYLYQIYEVIPILNQADIFVSDWSIQNIMLGKFNNSSEQLYLFDDSNYTIIDNCSDYNYLEFDSLISDFIFSYLNRHSMKRFYPYVFQDDIFRNQPLSYLQQISQNTDTLGEGIFSYCKKIK